MNLKNALKLAISAAFSWIICQFFGFSNTAFVAPIFCINIVLLGLGIGWYVATKVFFMVVIGLVFAILLLVSLGNNYLTFFIAILIIGLICNYFKNRGFLADLSSALFTLTISIVNSNSSDPVTFVFEMLMSVIIGIVVGMVANRLFWPTKAEDVLQQQLLQILQGSSELIEIMFNSYLARESLGENAIKLKSSLFKSLQASKKQLIIGNFDPTGKQLGKSNWAKIINSQEQILLHLSAIFNLIDARSSIDFSEEMKFNLKSLSDSITNALTKMLKAVNNDLYELDLTDLEVEFNQFKTKLTEVRLNQNVQKITLKQRIEFYSIVHRLEKLVAEITKWGVEKQSIKSNYKLQDSHKLLQT